jgi:hypothetical protein
VIEGNALTIPTSLVHEFSPEALAVMEMPAHQDIEVCRKMYARYPKFGEQVPGQPYWVYMRELVDRELCPEGAEGLLLLFSVGMATENVRRVVCHGRSR